MAGGVKPYYADESVTLYHGDAIEVLRELPDASVDAVVTDPPYGLEFMGREWDSFKPASARLRTRVDQRTNPAEGKSTTTTPEAYVAGVPFQRWCEAWAREVLRVLKPGGHLLAFGGTRTVHRLTCAIEDAGFEIRDGIDWLYASGFPKSLDVSKAIDKAAGAEREISGYESRHINRPATDGWDKSSAAKTGMGLPDIEQRGQLHPITAPATEDAARWSGWGTALKPAREPIVVARKPLAGTVAANVLAYGTGALNIDGCRIGTTVETWPVSATYSRYDPGSPSKQRAKPKGDPPPGRWPTNLVLSHAVECGDECVSGCPVTELDRQSGITREGSGPLRRNTALGVMNDDTWQPKVTEGARYAGEGGASRFFPVFRYEAKAPTAERPRVDGVAHPTVKPLDLMRWLVRLVTPTGGVVLEPFAGSGTTAEACVIEGFRCIAIEREPAYLPLITARLSKPLQVALFREESA